MNYRFLLLILLVCVAGATASAQAGPFAPATIGSGFPADLCKNFTGNTCIISELCSNFFAGGGCSGTGPGGNIHDSGGLVNWLINARNSSGANYNVNTNGSNTSQGYIVTIGSPGQSWTFAPNANTSSLGVFCTFAGIGGVLTNNTYGGSRTYYRTYEQCI